MNEFTRKETLLDHARLDAVIAPVVRAHGGEVVAVEWKQEPGGWVLRVFVEKAGSRESGAKTADAAVGLELCAGVARDLSPALDVADVIPHRYSLEVSSPGVERALRDARDYERFVGEKAKLRLREAVDGQKVLVGVLESAPDAPGSVGVLVGSRRYVVPLDQVVSARLVFEFGPAPKPKPARSKRGNPDERAKVARSKRQRSSGGETAQEGPEQTSKS